MSLETDLEGSEQQQGTGCDKSGAEGEDREPCRKDVGQKS